MRRLVSFQVDGAWQPLAPTGAAPHANAVGTAEFWALRRCYAVDSANGVRFHGAWTKPCQARRFAASMGRGAKVAKVAPYWWVPTWGRIGG